MVESALDVPRYCRNCGGDIVQGTTEHDVDESESESQDFDGFGSKNGVVDQMTLEYDTADGLYMDIVDIISNGSNTYRLESFVGGAEEYLSQFGTEGVNPVRVALCQSESITTDSDLVKSKTGIIATLKEHEDRITIGSGRVDFDVDELTCRVDSAFIGFKNLDSMGVCIPLSQVRDLEPLHEVQIDDVELEYFLD